MERLTRKSLEYKDNWIADGSLSNIEGVVRGDAIDRLAELEDVLESWHIENLEELELRLEDIEHYAYQANKQLIDILAKYGIKNAEELDKFIHDKDCQINKWKQDYENCSKLEKFMSKEHQYCLDNWRAAEQELAELARKYELSSLPIGGLVDEVRKLEQELAELKQKAIVPKFYTG